jgi:hypothetical protein
MNPVETAIPGPPPVPTPPPLPAAARVTPWFSIWTAPRPTLRAILAGAGPRRILPIAALLGISQALGAAVSRPLADTVPAGRLLAGALLLGPPIGVLWIHIMGFLVRLTGRWLGGRADAAAVRTALAWSSVPLAWGLLLWLPRAALLGDELFHPVPAGIEGHAPSEALFGLLVLLEAAIRIWALVAGAKCVGEAHRFSAWRAVGAFLLAGLILALPLGALAAVAVALGLTA